MTLKKIKARYKELPDRKNIESVFKCTANRDNCEHKCCDGKHCNEWFSETLTNFYQLATKDVPFLIKEIMRVQGLMDGAFQVSSLKVVRHRDI